MAIFLSVSYFAKEGQVPAVAAGALELDHVCVELQ
jgi:hypothetical protein